MIQLQETKTSYPYGPMFVSDEDIVSIMKDSEIYNIEGIPVDRIAEGYPLRTETETRIYSWGTGDMKDVIIYSILVKNKSTDTLKDCWLAGVYDFDITLLSNALFGSSNDRCRFVNEDTTLNLGACWTDTTAGEGGHGFGYMGVAMLENTCS